MVHPAHGTEKWDNKSYMCENMFHFSELTRTRT